MVAAFALVLCVSKEGVSRGPVARGLGQVWDFIVRTLPFVKAQCSRAWTCTYFCMSVLSGDEDKMERMAVCEVTGSLWKRYRSRCIGAAVHDYHFFFSHPLSLSLCLSFLISHYGGCCHSTSLCNIPVYKFVGTRKVVDITLMQCIFSEMIISLCKLMMA